MKKMEKYFSKHPYINSFTHVLVGLGLGALLTHPFFDPHPVRYGVILLGLGLIGHLYAYTAKS